MKRSQFLKFTSLLIILPLLYLPGCGGGGQVTQNNQNRQNNNQANNQNANQQSDSQEQTYGDEQTAAQKGLETLAKLVDAENFKDIGFESAEEVRSAALGTPLKVFLVGLDSLREYRKDAEPDALLTDVQRSVYPVLVNNQVRSSITVEGKNGKWSAVSFGDAYLMKKIDQALKGRVASMAKQATGPPTLVHVAFLNLYFVGQTWNNKLMLTTVTPLANTKFRESTTMSAAEAFDLLVPIARNYNGLPM